MWRKLPKQAVFVRAVDNSSAHTLLVEDATALLQDDVLTTIGSEPVNQSSLTQIVQRLEEGATGKEVELGFTRKRALSDPKASHWLLHTSIARLNSTVAALARNLSQAEVWQARKEADYLRALAQANESTAALIQGVSDSVSRMQSEQERGREEAERVRRSVREIARSLEGLNSTGAALESDLRSAQAALSEARENSTRLAKGLEAVASRSTTATTAAGAGSEEVKTLNESIGALARRLEVLTSEADAEKERTRERESKWEGDRDRDAAALAAWEGRWRELSGVKASMAALGEQLGKLNASVVPGVSARELVEVKESVMREIRAVNESAAGLARAASDALARELSAIQQDRSLAASTGVKVAREISDLERALAAVNTSSARQIRAATKKFAREADELVQKEGAIVRADLKELTAKLSSVNVSLLSLHNQVAAWRIPTDPPCQSPIPAHATRRAGGGGAHVHEQVDRQCQCRYLICLGHPG